MFRLCLLPLAGSLVIVCAAASHAQVPPVTPPPLSGLPSTPAIAPPPGEPEKADVKLQLPNAQIGDVIDFYANLTGKRMIPDQTVLGTINIVINKSVTKEEAIRIIETALNLNGYALVPGSGDIIKVLGLGKPVRNAGVPIFSELSAVPEGEQTVSYFLRLRYLDAQEIFVVLQQYIQPNSLVAFTPLPKSGAIIITDTANGVRRLVGLLSQIDTPAAPVVEKFIRLERADATKAVEFLNSVFETKTAGAAGSPAVPNAGNVRRPIRRLNEDGQPVLDNIPSPNVPGGLIALSGESIIQGRATLTADIRTNRVHVVTQPVNLPLIERLIAEYDSNTPFATPVRRPLRFVSARDVLPILVQALTEPGSENGQNGANPLPGATPRPNNSNTNNNNLFNNNNNNNGSSGSNSIGAEELNTEAVDTTPTEAVVGSTKIIADQRSNTIILLGGAEAKDKVYQILDQLDVRAPQVIIRAIIGELSLGKNYEFGLNYILRRKGLALERQFTPGLTTNGTTTGGATGTGTTTTGTDFAATNSSTLQTLTNLAAGVGSGFSGFGGIISVTNSFDIIASLLDANNRFKTISRPQIFISNNKKGIIASGQEIAVPTNSLSSLNGSATGDASVATSVQFKSVTLQLEVVPLINSDREVTLDIVQQIDSVVSGQNVQVGGNSIPTIATRKIKSNVSMPNGSTVVLGGLITQNDAKSDNNIPYLNRIPLVGPLLFSSRTRDQSRSELIVLLHPEVVNTSGLLEQKRQEEEDRLNLGHDLEGQLLPTRKIKPTTETARRARPVTPAAVSK